jgi:uncharacterized membrane protein YbhN (UPF0104 family)
MSDPRPAGRATTGWPERRLRPRHFVVGIVAAMVAGIALVTGVGQVAGFDDVRQAVSGADVAWLGLCAIGQLLVFGAYSGALHRTIASGGGGRVASGVLVRVVLASFAATQVFAFGGVGGLAIVYWALRRVGLDRDDAAVRLIGLNTAVYLVFGAIGWSAAAWALVAGTAPVAMALPWLVAFPVVVLVARWFTAPRRVTRWTGPSTARRRRALATGVAAAAWVRRTMHDPDGRMLFAWAAGYWIGDVVSLWAALHAYGAEPHIAPLVAAYTTGYLVQSLPIPLIATGGVDAATTFLLHAVGVPLELALVGVVTHRVFAFWLPVIPGAAFGLSLPRLGRSLATARST